MVNPFHIGGPTGSDAFCDRLLEREDLRTAVDRVERVLVVGDRHIGKTSLVQRVLSDLPDREVMPVYVDLRGVDGTASFVDLMARAYTQAAATPGEGLLETARSLFRVLSCSVVRTEGGGERLRFEDSMADVSLPALQEVLHTPNRISQRDRRRMAVALDHVDRLADLGDSTLFRALFEAVNTQAGTAYLFGAGRRRPAERLFLDDGAPLGELATPYSIGPIAPDHWIPFIRSRFFRARKIIEKETVRNLFFLTGGHPYAMQRIANALWELTAPDEIATERRLERAVDLMLRREAAVYEVLWESLSLNQQRLLRALALGPAGASPFSASFVRSSHMGSASSVQRALQSLIERDLVSRDLNEPAITDRFLAVWLKRLG